MDRAPAAAEAAALAAIESLRPLVQLQRLRIRQAGGRQFADVVIGVPSISAVGQGHAAADAVEEALERALPGSDVVVHVEPLQDASLRDRVHAAALAVPNVREIHNLVLVEVGRRTELSLHLKLPGSSRSRTRMRWLKRSSRPSTAPCPRWTRCRRTSSR